MHAEKCWNTKVYKPCKSELLSQEIIMSWTIVIFWCTYVLTYTRSFTNALTSQCVRKCTRVYANKLVHLQMSWLVSAFAYALGCLQMHEFFKCAVTLTLISTFHPRTLQNRIEKVIFRNWKFSLKTCHSPSVLCRGFQSWTTSRNGKDGFQRCKVISFVWQLC